MIIGEIDRVERIPGHEKPAVWLLADPGVSAIGAIDAQKRLGDITDRRHTVDHAGTLLAAGGEHQCVGNHGVEILIRHPKS